MRRKSLSLVVIGATMVQTLVCGGADATVAAPLSLDNTVSNEFWCTWNYVNAASSNAVCVVGGGVDSVRIAPVASAADAAHPFSTGPSGLIIIVR